MPSSGAFIGTTRCQARGHWLLWRLLETSLASMLVGVLRVAFAAPTGGQVASGIAVISQTGIPGQVSTTISQGSAQASLNWQSFNIAKGETVNFVQPSANALTVNRITDVQGSQILGQINANGQVWLFNPNGVLFGKDAQVNVGALLASTLDIRDADSSVTIYLSELPGTHAQMTVQPGQSFGLSDLNIEVKAAQSMAGAFILDNSGNAYTGRNRLGLNQQFFNPLGRGDAVSIHVLTSGENLTSGRIAYETVWGRPALSLGLAASKFDYQLGDSARSLMAGGSAQQASAWVQYYFFRRLQVNVKGRLQLDSFALNDRIEVTDTTTAKRISAYSLELLGDRAGAGPGQSSNTWVLGLHGGTTAFENASAAFADSSSAHIAGDYGFVTLKMQREQFLSPRMSWYAAFSGQWANTNLDGSQKFALGGPHSVRAYESGVLNGDSGQLWTLEWRYKPAMPTGWSADNLVQARVFWDYGQLKVNQKPWSNAENAFAISGMGWGFDWQLREGWRASINMAWADANIPAILANANASRLGAWFELRRAY